MEIVLFSQPCRLNRPTIALLLRWSHLASPHLQFPIGALRSRHPTELALKHYLAETKDGSMSFPYINTVLNIKL